MSYHRESIANLTKNAMNITKHLVSKTEFKKKNVVLSPLSLQTVLSIVAAGSEGPTQCQLLSFLGSKSIDHLNSLSTHLFTSVLDDAAPFGGPQLSFVNSVWFEKSLSLYPSFKEIVDTNYFATLRSLDFINKVPMYIFLFSLEQYIFLFSRTIKYIFIFFANIFLYLMLS